MSFDRKANARRLFDVPGMFDPLAEWAESRIAALRADLEGGDANNVAEMGRLQGQIQAMKSVTKLKVIVDAELGVDNRR